MHYRFEFADRSLAARQCAALVAVKPQELLCESIQLRCAKRVGSWAGLRDLWRCAAPAGSPCADHARPRALCGTARKTARRPGPPSTGGRGPRIGSVRTSRPRTRSRLPTLTSLRPPSAKSSRRTKWCPRLPSGQSQPTQKDPILQVQNAFSRRWETQLWLRSCPQQVAVPAVAALRARPFAFATRSTANSSPRSRA